MLSPDVYIYIVCANRSRFYSDIMNNLASLHLCDTFRLSVTLKPPNIFFRSIYHPYRVKIDFHWYFRVAREIVSSLSSKDWAIAALAVPADSAAVKFDL